MKLFVLTKIAENRFSDAPGIGAIDPFIGVIGVADNIEILKIWAKKNFIKEYDEEYYDESPATEKENYFYKEIEFDDFHIIYKIELVDYIDVGPQSEMVSYLKLMKLLI